MLCIYLYILCVHNVCLWVFGALRSEAYVFFNHILALTLLLIFINFLADCSTFEPDGIIVLVFEDRFVNNWLC